MYCARTYLSDSNSLRAVLSRLAFRALCACLGVHRVDFIVRASNKGGSQTHIYWYSRIDHFMLLSFSPQPQAVPPLFPHLLDAATSLYGSVFPHVALHAHSISLRLQVMFCRYAVTLFPCMWGRRRNGFFSDWVSLSLPPQHLSRLDSVSRAGVRGV